MTLTPLDPLDVQTDARVPLRSLEATRRLHSGLLAAALFVALGLIALFLGGRP